LLRQPDRLASSQRQKTKNKKVKTESKNKKVPVCLAQEEKNLILEFHPKAEPT
jgi:hypothetical protein